MSCVRLTSAFVHKPDLTCVAWHLHVCDREILDHFMDCAQSWAKQETTLSHQVWKSFILPVQDQFSPKKGPWKGFIFYFWSGPTWTSGCSHRHTCRKVLSAASSSKATLVATKAVFSTIDPTDNICHPIPDTKQKSQQDSCKIPLHNAPSKISIVCWSAETGKRLF